MSDTRRQSRRDRQQGRLLAVVQAVVPGMAPGAPRRNALVFLYYVFVAAIVTSYLATGP